MLHISGGGGCYELYDRQTEINAVMIECMHMDGVLICESC